MPTATRIRDHCLAPGRAVDAPAPGGGYRRLFPELDPLDCEDDALHALGRAAAGAPDPARSYDDIARAFDGEPVGNLTRDEVLDNITLTWVTNTGVSSGRLYWENTLGFFDVKGVTVPAAVSIFPNELYQAPRSWTEQAYPNLIYFHQVDKGNHFAAWQEPELFTTEVQAAFRSLR